MKFSNPALVTNPVPPPPAAPCWRNSMRATKCTCLNPGTKADNSSLDAGGSSQTTGNDTSVPTTDMGDDGDNDDNDNEHEDNDVAMQDDPHGDPDFMPSGQPKPPGVHRQGQGPALLSPRQYAKVWAHSRDSNGGSDADVEEGELESSLGDKETMLEGECTHVDVSAPHTKFLLKLSLPYLKNFLAHIQQDVQDLGDNWATLTVAQQHALRTVHQVLHQSGRPVQFTSGYSAHLTLLWDLVMYLQQRNNFHHLQVQMVRSEYMLAITAAWTWLDVDIPSLAFGLLKHQVVETAHNKWLSKLLADIRLQLSKCALDGTPLRSSDYLSLPVIQTYTILPKVSVPRSAGEDVWNTTVVQLLCLALAALLKYPNNQNWMQAAFVRHMLSAMGNADILLIPGVFECFQRIRPNIFGSASACMSRLSLEHMAPFAEDLVRQPLTKQGSPEHGTLAEITGNLETLCDLWRNFGGYGCNIPTLPGHPIGSDAYMDAFNSAAAALATFLRELLPLLSPTLPTPLSAMQQHVHINRDFLLPFHQHAPEVANAFSPHSCLSADNINKPGVVASLWCLRGIFYRTRFSSEHPRSLLFTDYPAWQAKYLELCADPQVASFNQGKDRYFCNAWAYGQATTRSTEYAEAYFVQESTWLAEFDGQAPEWSMPFKDAYLFTQRKDGKGHKLLPQLGCSLVC
ncbi:hypothetical protein C8Q79DRAFT_1013031 [Trametes meyenii]|nr:hypothetical protein C8Q79DRAFT_1013031 [Trametes meyenii]